MYKVNPCDTGPSRLGRPIFSERGLTNQGARIIVDDGRPIWPQLSQQLARRIITGVYPPGSKLPSVRELAAEAGVNPNTMQRALAQLEQEGLAWADRTAGRLVTQNTAVLEAARLRAAQAVSPG